MTIADGEGTSRRTLLYRAAAWFSQAAIGLVVGVPAVGYLLDPLHRRGEGAGWTLIGSVDVFPLDLPVLVRTARRARDGYLERTERRAVWVVRGAEGVRAYSASCTHLGCQVAWNPSTGRFECPCHGGRFSIEGDVLAGPPPRPLVRFETRVRQGALEVREARS